MDKKRGRPKGSKNKPKPEVEVVEQKFEKIDAVVGTNNWRLVNGYMLPVTDIDFGENKSILGRVEGFGDFDFGILPPYFKGRSIRGGSGEMDFLPNRKEKVTKGFVSLHPNNKPKVLLIFGHQLIGPNEWGPEKSLTFSFPVDYWTEEDDWMEP
jgi:hypothetical protein